MLQFISSILGAIAMFMTLITVRSLVQAMDASLMMARIDMIFFMIMTAIVGGYVFTEPTASLMLAAILQISLCALFMREVRQGFKYARIPQPA